jgi:hypothetical protein
MLVITALLAVGMAFVGTKVNRARNEQAIANEITRSGGSFQRQSYGMAASTTDRTWFERWLDLDLEARIVQVSLGGWEVTDADVQRLAGLSDLAHLSLTSCNLDGTSLAALEGLPHLTAIAVSGSALTDEGIAALGRLPAVERLSIDAHGGRAGFALRLTDAGLAQLKHLKSLRHLALGTSQFTDDRLRALSGLAQIEVLVLSRTGLTDAGLPEMLDGLTGLRSLNIQNAMVTGPGLAKLRDCPRLLSLRLSCPLTDDSLTYLANVRQLAQLDIGGASGLMLTDKGLAHLEQLTNLTQLSLNGSRFGDAGLQHLSRLTALVDVQLEPAKAEFTYQGLKYLESLTNLKTLRLTTGAGVPVKLSPTAIYDLQRAVPGLIVQQ